MKTCLVIIDMQNGFISKSTEKLVNKIYDFAISHKFDSIVGTRYINNENTACYKFEHWKKCMEGSEESEFHPKLLPLCSKIFSKSKYSCWNDEFKTFVNKEKFDKIFFVGVNTGCCVLHSAFDCYNDLQDCTVIEDLCGSSTSIDSHNCAIRVLKECITKERVILSNSI